MKFRVYICSVREDAARDDGIVLVVTSDGHMILQDRFVGGANWADPLISM